MFTRIQTAKPGRLTAALVVLGLTAAGATADTIYVCWDGSGDYLTIQEGIDAAQDGDEVVVCDGTYTGEGNKDLDFGGKSITVRSASGDPDLCIIDCEGSDSDPHRGFYLHSGETAVVDGFTITNGYTSDDGGGVYCEGVQATITNCTISGNQAGYSGGGVYCGDGSLTIRDCTITGNSVPGHGPGWGAGVCCAGASLTIRDCTISGNEGRDGGGGVCCFGGQATITNCTISGNQAVGGGGVFCAGGQTTITNCTISSNAAGGGVCCYGGQPTITNCTISSNSGEWGGGVYCGGGATITNCTISGNSGELGGGVCCDHGSPTITNCTIADNAANGGPGGGINFGWGAESPVVTNCLITGNTATGSGGGLCYDGRTVVEPTLTNCTFAHNTAAEYGGAVYCYGEWWTTMDLSMTNCILWADLAPEGAEIALEGVGRHTVSYSDVQGGEAQVYVGEGSELIWGEGNIDADPLFVTGPFGNYYLSQTAAGQEQDSPCVDAGSDTAENLGLNTRTTRTDQVPDSAIVDMGYHYPSLCLGDLNDDGKTDQSDLGILLADWGCDDPVNGCAGDLNGDDKTDQSDLGILLADWGCGTRRRGQAGHTTSSLGR